MILLPVSFNQKSKRGLTTYSHTKLKEPRYGSTVHPKASITGSRLPCALWKSNGCTNLGTSCTYLCMYDQIGPAQGVKMMGKTLIQQTTNNCDKCFKELQSIFHHHVISVGLDVFTLSEGKH